MRDGNCTAKLKAKASAMLLASLDCRASRKFQAIAGNTPGTNFCQAPNVVPSCDSAISIQPSTYWVEAEPRMSGSVSTSASARTFWPTGTPTIWVDALTEACATDPALTICAGGMV